MTDFFIKLIMDNAVLITGTLLMLVTVVPYMVIHNKNTKKMQVKQVEAEQYGLAEPVTIHPHVNRGVCIGSGACITACPEKDILGRIRGKAEAVYASRCVGHGACARACPTGAIELVFGTEKRGVELPQVFPNFETNVKQLFIAGELGGMGLIKNAMTQGQEAIQYIKEDYKKNGYKPKEGMLDILVVGAGPAGLAATLQAIKEKLKSATLDQEDTYGGAILSYPRAKLVMTRPVDVPLYGRIKRREYSKEELIKLWDDIAKKTSLKVDANEKVIEARKEEESNGKSFFMVKTSKRDIKTRYLLLCIGRRGTPRKLGVQGEKLPKVMYRMLEPEKYANQKVLIVGGGDSAVEAATAISSQKGTEVTLSYRKGVFSRIKPANQQRIEKAFDYGEVKPLLSSTVKEIRPKSVIISTEDGSVELENDSVFIFAGGELPNDFLKKVGINIETKFGTS